MVKFNELRIEDGCFIIDVSIRELPYYQNVYLKSIKIDTQDTFIDSFPSKNAIYTKYLDMDKEGNEVCIQDFRLEIPQSEIPASFSDTLFFVYVEVYGNPRVDTPCGMDDTYTLGVVYNDYMMYRKLLNHVRELAETCEIPKNFINDYLQYQAFCYAINAGHYVEGIKYFNKFILGRRKKGIQKIRRCCT